MMVFTGARSLDWNEWATERFVSRRSQHFAFSSLHEIILKLRYASLGEEISRLSVNHGTIDIRDVWGRSPLFWASIRGDTEAICRLLESGADPNIVDNCGQTPLQLSARCGKLDCAMHLLHRGADPQYSDLEGWTTLSNLCAHSIHQPSRSKIIEFLDTLFHMGVDVNVQGDSGYSPLCFSLQSPEHGGNIPLRWCKLISPRDFPLIRIDSCVDT